MKYQIMLKIMTQLLSKRKLTAREIAERYDISVRSVYRYVEELNVCGVPVDVERGRYGGISIADTFRLPSGYFTRGEYAAAVNALALFESQVGGEDAASAREKLESKFKSERKELSVCGNIIVDGGIWGDADKFSEKMRVCEQAVNECRCLAVDYVSREGEHSVRIIEPHVLVFKQNVWYVYAFCHTKQEFRTFKIGRIKKASFTGEIFTKRDVKREDIPLDFSYAREKLVPVTLSIEKASLADAEEWLGIDNIEPRGDGFVAEVTLPDDGELVRKILSYGGAVKVLAPQSLAERVKRVAKKIASS